MGELSAEADSYVVVDFLMSVVFQIGRALITRNRNELRSWLIEELCLMPLHIIGWAMMRSRVFYVIRTGYAKLPPLPPPK